MPQQKGGSAKKKTFIDLCNSFTEACLEAVSNECDDEPVTELIDILRNATKDSPNLNDADISAIKVDKFAYTCSELYYHEIACEKP